MKLTKSGNWVLYMGEDALTSPPGCKPFSGERLDFIVLSPKK